MIFIIGGASEGQAEYAAAQYPMAGIIGAYHMRVREQMTKGLDPLMEAEKLLQKNDVGDELVIWSCEIGCGLVPADPFERAWREASGRVNCYFAAQADRVIRMVCGIGTVLK